ncbi:MAG: hypothetical protein WBA51_17655 [Erythrobacter sp.]
MSFRKIGQRIRDRSLDHHGSVKPGACIFAVGLASQLMRAFMISGVPSIICNIDSAAKGGISVDDDNFLMLCCSHRMMAIQMVCSI